MPRGDREEWLVVAGPVELDQDLPWQHVRDGTAIRIPLVPYRLPGDANLALTGIMSRGLRAGLGIHQITKQREIVRIHMVIGDTAADLAAEGHPGQIRYYVGFALQIG